MTQRRNRQSAKGPARRSGKVNSGGTRRTKARPRPQHSDGIGAGSVTLIVLLSGAAVGLSLWSGACSNSKRQHERPEPASGVASAVRPVRPVPRVATAASSSAEPNAPVDAGVADTGPADAAEPPWDGAWVGAIVQTAPIYGVMSRSRSAMVGNMRYGEKAPALATPLKRSNCKQGWYQLHPYGYVCGRHATAKLSSSRFRSAPKPPDIEATVPYRYAYNRKNGTPLYRSIPTREQMLTYEPYLKKTKKKHVKHHPQTHDGGVHVSPAVSASASARVLKAVLPALDAGAAPKRADAGIIGILDAGTDAQPEVPWWQDTSDGGARSITLEDMEVDSDHILSKRMAKGFFIAITRSFRRNRRYWYRTTEGLFAPADRMSINAPPTFHGVVLGQADSLKLPLGFIVRAKAPKYDLLEGGKKLRRHGRLKRFTVVSLTGKTMRKGRRLYRESTDGFWVRAHHLDLVEPGPPPSGVGPSERWIDVNLTQQTLVAFEGTKPVYATIVSSGKKSRNKKRDHRTVQGTFRVREKHVTATMDGDGAAPGEGPYSIQDVPYVMYFKRSYAIHGAFWHNNFGHRMSHGCVNLAPLDAKHIFFWADPQIPEGWHGVWSSNDHPGSRIVVHE